MVTRPEKIKMEYYNFEGEKKEIELEGFLSAVAQHEIDHLDGILFIDKAKDIYRLSDEEIQKIKNAKV
jgi:peptide deformylase